MGVSPAMAILSVQHTQEELNLPDSDHFSAVENDAKTKLQQHHLLVLQTADFAITSNSNCYVVNSYVFVATRPTDYWASRVQTGIHKMFGLIHMYTSGKVKSKPCLCVAAKNLEGLE